MRTSLSYSKPSILILGSVFCAHAPHSVYVYIQLCLCVFTNVLLKLFSSNESQCGRGVENLGCIGLAPSHARGSLASAAWDMKRISRLFIFFLSAMEIQTVCMLRRILEVCLRMS